MWWRSTGRAKLRGIRADSRNSQYKGRDRANSSQSNSGDNPSVTTTDVAEVVVGKLGSQCSLRESRHWRERAAWI